MARPALPGAEARGVRVAGGPTDLPARFAAHLERRPGLIPEGSGVLVALSGGPDSTALLHLLLGVAERRALRLAAAHFDHGARPESAEEARLVAARARDEAGVPCRIGRAPADLPRTQAAFRRARYAFLREAAAAEEADRIATGHHADDQAETVLHRILRGTGIRGLAGIPARSGPVVRPLLPFTGEEVRAFLRERETPFLEDPSNRDPRWTRTRIRHEVLPALERVAGDDVRDRLRALARHARRAERALEAAAREALERSLAPGSRPERIAIVRDVLASYDPELQARVVRMAARRLGAELARGGTRAAVEFIKRGRSGAGVDISDNVRIWREFDVLRIGAPPDVRPDGSLEIPGTEAGRGQVAIAGRRYRVAWGPAATEEEARWSAALEPGEVAFPLRLRGPRPGDRFRLQRGERKLKRLFGELRVPVSERRSTPVLAEAGGRVVWVAGIGTAEGASPPEGEGFVVRVSEA